MPASSLTFTHDVTERFLRYVVIDTQSDPASPTCPSTEKQKNLGRLLAAELQAMGLADAHLDDALATLRKCSLIHGDWMSDDAQWAIYGTLRRWLAASPRLSAEDRQKAHRAAADYLITLCEQNATGPAQSLRDRVYHGLGRFAKEVEGEVKGFGRDPFDRH